MKLIWITFLSFSLYSCQATSSDTNSNAISNADSVALQNEILHSMEEDLFDKTYIETNMDTTFIVQKYSCYPRPHFKIRINNKNQMMVRGEIDVPIIPRLMEFYTANKERNDVTTNFPMYSRINEQEILEQINRAQNELKEAKENKQSYDKVEFKEKILFEWERKLKALKTLNLEELPEITTTYVSIEGSRKSKVDSKRVLDSVLVGFYLLRDLVAREYFKESYVSIYNNYKVHGSQNSLNQLEALKILYPVAVFDETRLKKYKNIFTVEAPNLAPPINSINEIEQDTIEVELEGILE